MIVSAMALAKILSLGPTRACCWDDGLVGCTKPLAVHGSLAKDDLGLLIRGKPCGYACVSGVTALGWCFEREVTVRFEVGEAVRLMIRRVPGKRRQGAEVFESAKYKIRQEPDYTSARR
ncbi:hypothetical protein BKA81DRAFT_363561 [Phyllosticta paracitricarpa]